MIKLYPYPLRISPVRYYMPLDMSGVPTPLFPLAFETRGYV